MASRQAVPGLLLCLAALICIGAAADSDIQLSGVTVALIEGGGSVAQSHAAASPDASKQLGTLDQTRTLKVTLNVALEGESDFRPQQAFLRLTSRSSGLAAYFAAVKDKQGVLYATASAAEVQKQAGQQGGAFDVALLVGDARSPQPVEWALGEVTVLHPPLDDGSQPQDRPYWAMDALFRPQPEIMHQHRQPERRTPGIVSLFFALLAFTPLVAFGAVAIWVGANMKGFPTGGAAFLAAAGFHLGLAATCGLYLLFWIKLNLMQAVPILAVLAAVTAVFGGSTLRGLAVQQKAAKQE